MSTYALYGEIVFPAFNGRKAFKIRRFSECKIESSWQSLTDTAEIIIPRKVKDFDRMNVSEWFCEGSPIEIKLGYGLDIYTEFVGYLTAIPAGIPLVLKCEDEMYKLKRTIVSVSKKDCSLKELLQAIAPGYTIVCDETIIAGTFRFPKMTQAQCLDSLKKQGIACFFVGKTLHAMDISSRLDLTTHDIVLEKTAGESLKQKEIAQTKVIIELTRNKGKKLKVEIGDEPASTILRKEYSGMKKTEQEMLDEAKKIYNRAKTPGMDSNVTLFGTPRVVLGDKLKLSSKIYKDAPEYKATYNVDAITKTFTQQGYRQVCKLGDKSL